MTASLAGQVEDSLIVLGAHFDGKVGLCAQASEAAIAAGHSAGTLVRKLTEALGGKGGGKDNFAMVAPRITENLLKY